MATVTPGILTLRELSQRIGVLEVTLRSWRHRGTGPASFKIGASVVYRLEDVQAWEAQNQIEHREADTA